MGQNYCEEVKNLILEYKNQNRNIDQEYIRKILEIVIVSETLQEVLESHCINNDSKQKQYVMTYSSVFKEITLYPHNIENNYNNNPSIQTIHSNNLEAEYVKFLYLNRILFHELNHAYYVNRMNQQKNQIDNLETRMLFFEFQYSGLTLEQINHMNKWKYEKWLWAVKRYNKTYYKNIQNSLKERLANLYSYQVSRKIADLLNLPQISMWEHLQELKLYTRANAGKSPTLSYLKKICSLKEFRELQKQIEMSSLSLETRLKYGLEITPLEFEQILIQKKELERKLKMF